MNIRKFLKLFAKITLTAVAVYLVVRKIDVRETFTVLSSLKVGWMLLAFLFFNLSKIVSAFRLLAFLRIPSINLSGATGIKLCYVGMFYNLFLPGGIGGDGYKMYLLKKNYREHSLKKIIAAALLDRISGMMALVFLAIILYSFTSVNYYLRDFRLNFLYFFVIAAFYPMVYLVNHIFFKSFKSVFLITNVQSLAVQLLQLVSAFFILLALDIHVFYIDYLDLFLVSSVVAILPITIGGIGARELVFIYGYEFLPIDKNAAVAFSITFFIITVISSLAGAFVKITKEEEPASDGMTR